MVVRKYERITDQRIACYDKGSKYFDRYTVLYLDDDTENGPRISMVGMSEHPFHPQGFGQHGTTFRGRHLGRRILFSALPKDCQQLVKRDLWFLCAASLDLDPSTALPVKWKDSQS